MTDGSASFFSVMLRVYSGPSRCQGSSPSTFLVTEKVWCERIRKLYAKTHHLRDGETFLPGTLNS